MIYTGEKRLLGHPMQLWHSALRIILQFPLAELECWKAFFHYCMYRICFCLPVCVPRWNWLALKMSICQYSKCYVVIVWATIFRTNSKKTTWTPFNNNGWPTRPNPSCACDILMLWIMYVQSKGYRIVFWVLTNYPPLHHLHRQIFTRHLLWTTQLYGFSTALNVNSLHQLMAELVDEQQKVKEVKKCFNKI